MEKKFTKDEISEKYNGFSRYYDFIEFIPERLFMGRLRRNLLSKAEGKVLELSVGTGVNLKYYKKGCEVIGIDISEGMIERARRKAKVTKLNVILRKDDVEKMNFKKGSFDYVVDTLGLCGYEDPVKVLKEIKRVCKKNGKIFLIEHGISNKGWLARLQRRHEDKHYKRSGCSGIRDHEVLVKKAGLKFVNSERKLKGVLYIIVAKP
jgi:ubiquinone/menaquinone biosynthesis C-methylase UbiE